jgi:hypothetical protein
LTRQRTSVGISPRQKGGHRWRGDQEGMKPAKSGPARPRLQQTDPTPPARGFPLGDGSRSILASKLRNVKFLPAARWATWNGWPRSSPSFMSDLSDLDIRVQEHIASCSDVKIVDEIESSLLFSSWRASNSHRGFRTSASSSVQCSPMPRPQLEKRKADDSSGPASPQSAGSGDQQGPSQPCPEDFCRMGQGPKALPESPS